MIIIPQPEWRDTKDCRLGRPRLGVLVSAGNLDSMLNKRQLLKSRSTDVIPLEEGWAAPRPSDFNYNRIREL